MSSTENPRASKGNLRKVRQSVCSQNAYPVQSTLSGCKGTCTISPGICRVDGFLYTRDIRHKSPTPRFLYYFSVLWNLSKNSFLIRPPVPRDNPFPEKRVQRYTFYPNRQNFSRYFFKRKAPLTNDFDLNQLHLSRHFNCIRQKRGTWTVPLIL